MLMQEEQGDSLWLETLLCSDLEGKIEGNGMLSFGGICREILSLWFIHKKLPFRILSRTCHIGHAFLCGDLVITLPASPWNTHPR